MGQSAKLERQSLRKHANIPNFHDAKNQRILHSENHILPSQFILLEFTIYSQVYSPTIYF
jgi:hypothetical protein